MSECPICGNSWCGPIFHDRETQLRYAPAIKAFKSARDIRDRIDAEIERENRLEELRSES